MANATGHRVSAALVVGLTALYHEKKNGEFTAKSLAAAGTAAVFGTLPDIIEPALRNPHHRQFFHSVAFMGLVSYGVYRAYKWQPDTPEEKFLRWIAMVAGGAYLTHLAMDASTSRSLPLIGKL